MTKCALAKDKKNRYQTARDLSDELKNLKRNADIPGELIPSGERGKFTGSRGAAASPKVSVSSLEYAVTQAKSNKLATTLLGVVLFAMIFAVTYFGFFHTTNARQIGSIAVMPFVNEGGDSDAEYLSDGMTETLISSLSKLPNLNVKARSIVFRYKDRETELKKSPPN